ncbi:MAG: ribose-5-phosphate isomerase [Candidatus Taylorbacteria bacterium CG10_big_fil_rev_8_21_14_0_10_41_48]|uniref:Ribose-5-phosphate isomerase n=1 Tax=Candidatus Taylorbacteria bacterium CG10_big_fil_rev_8_21_14_0_10_41_48 TaxID=1975024 RepID=A0A2M8LCL3_9BACT|nr:MAG: ribose-5-phosphate isomerase [Candidatus Taylorbacteria bacterium CG10_big_fil_rev_8_21_14_0_10_41_48]
MKILIASDHAGFDLKNTLVGHLRDTGHEVTDMGPKEYTADDDYPDYISLVAREIEVHPSGIKGIVIGGSGQGEAICANKFYGVRAAVYYGGNMDIVRLSREHNDANVLSLGARFLSPDEAKRAVKLWLDTAFSGDERHKRRIGKIFNIIHSKKNG